MVNKGIYIRNISLKYHLSVLFKVEKSEKVPVSGLCHGSFVQQPVW